jgi:hypothetical protein
VDDKQPAIPEAESVYVGIRTALYRDDYRWIVRVATKHDVPIDTIIRAAVEAYRALTIAEIVSIDTIRDAGKDRA